MIIGLTGYAQSGKDTLANILVEKYGYTRIAFADKIRSFAYELNPLVGDGMRLTEVVDSVGWDKAKVENPEIRKILQDLGVGARKVFGTQFWVNEAMRSMLRNPNVQLRYVITDVRFLNEAQAIKLNDGQIWRIKRNGVGPVNNHVSESELDDYKVDQIFANNGTVQALQELVKKRMTDLLHEQQSTFE